MRTNQAQFWLWGSVAALVAYGLWERHAQRVAHRPSSWTPDFPHAADYRPTDPGPPSGIVYTPRTLRQ